MTSKVEKKGDSDDDIYDMLENMQAMWVYTMDH